MRLAFVPLVACLLLSSAAASAHQQPPVTARAELDALQKLYGEPFRETPFPGLYELNRPVPASARATAPILMTGGGEYTFNNGKLGAQRGDTGENLSAAEWGKLLLRWRGFIRYDDLIQQGGNGPLRMLLLSAFDCPYSKKLEAALGPAGMRYAIIPSIIGTANSRYLPGIWCSPDRAAAWKAATGSGVLPSRTNAACRYDRRYFEMLSGMFGGSKPTALFADGTIVRSPDPAFVKKKLAELAARGVEF